MKLGSGRAIPAPGPERTRYPWPQMKVGDDLFVKESELPKCGYASLRSAAWHWTKSHPGWKFTCKKEKGGYRVWRVA